MPAIFSLIISLSLPAVFSALEKVKFRGWGVVELDRVPNETGTPKQSAMISREFLEKKIGVKFKPLA